MGIEKISKQNSLERRKGSQSYRRPGHGILEARWRKDLRRRKESAAACSVGRLSEMR